MKSMTVGEISRALGGRILQGEPGRYLRAVSTDTRTLKPGELFFALRGTRFDGHSFIPAAVEAGAGGLVVEREEVAVPSDVPVILVEDTLAALQALASYNRRQFDLPVIGVTGSNGKTTTKDMVASVLSSRFVTLKTSGNFNNEIGLPLTLLKLDDTYRAVVLEMAMRGRGEIDLLCRIAAPTGAVITNVGEAHLERLGSVEEIARAKGEILDHIPGDGFAVLNGESELIRAQAGRCRGRVVYFGLRPGLDVYARDIFSTARGSRFTVVGRWGEFEVNLPVPGRHNIMNALAAVAVGFCLGLACEEIAGGLESVVLSGMRTDVLEAGSVTVINDAYNANPTSMLAALRALEEVAGRRRKVAVLGNMLELGEASRSCHLAVGEAAARAGVDRLFTVGDLAGDIARGAVAAGMDPGLVVQCRNNGEAVAGLLDFLAAGDVVLVKGSRAMHMEEIVRALVSNCGRFNGSENGNNL